jgi:hypothetical protein
MCLFEAQEYFKELWKRQLNIYSTTLLTICQFPSSSQKTYWATGYGVGAV